jgi:hypothetical protein
VEPETWACVVSGFFHHMLPTWGTTAPQTQGNGADIAQWLLNNWPTLSNNWIESSKKL